MKKFLALIFFLAALLPVDVLAISDNIVINEYLPRSSTGHEWIELYNPTDVDKDISNWIIKDNENDSIKNIPPDTIIGSKNFLVFTFYNKLNNDGDSISLKTAPGGTLVDSHAYSGLQEIGVSIGRLPDGENNWETFISPTQGYSNNPASPTPTPTQTPTETPTAIPTPTPSLEPSESPTPTSTPTEVPTPTATVAPTLTPTPTILPSPPSTLYPTPTPINYQEIFERRMICRFSYNRLRRLPNAEYFINLLKIVFGPQSVCP